MKAFIKPRLWGRIETDSHSRTIEINLAEEAEEYGALERLKIITAQAAVSSNQALLVNKLI
jgi:hypothetical protein